MKDETESPLVISEISSLWQQYMSDMSSIWIFKYFLNNVKDKETEDILQFALSLSEKHTKKVERIYKQEGLPIPKAFSEADVDLNAPRLFTDAYYLLYLSHMAGFGAEAYALDLRYLARSDIREYYSKCIAETVNLYNRAIDLRIAKGQYIKAPRVEVSKESTFIEDRSIFRGFFTTEPRPMLGREATNLFTGLLMDMTLKATASGFGQVARSERVRDYMNRGKEIAKQHFENFETKLRSEDIPVPSAYESYVTDSTSPPFSDKKMMFQMLTMCEFAILVDGAATATSLRSDIAAVHLKNGAEFGKYAKDGMDIMIENGWMEQPPQVINHEALMGV